MGERPLFSIIQSYKVGQHIEILVHPNHTIDNNYVCTHIEKNTHCQLYACWEKNDLYTYDQLTINICCYKLDSDSIITNP